MFSEILSQIKQHDTIIIHRHKKPDGDALGSQIGLKHILKENFPDKQVFMVGDPAGNYAFMKDSVMDDIPECTYEGALAIVLDCSAKFLISDERYTLAAKTARIDHHIFVETIADVEVTDTSYESCCGLIAEMARANHLKLTPLAAESLYTGMVTDSGRFRYDAVSAQTFRLAAFLMEQPINTNEIYLNLYADDLASKQLRARFIQNIRLTPQNVAYIYTTQADFDALGLDSFTISRGMVSTMADMKGVDIWVNFTETAEGVLCELRSSRYNINPIAVKYGGGGHAKASGATVKDYGTAMSMLRDLDALTMTDLPKGH